MPSKFCTKCGSAVAEGKKFCSRCGAAIGQSVPASEPAAVEPSANREPAMRATPSVKNQGFESIAGASVYIPLVPQTQTGRASSSASSTGPEMDSPVSMDRLAAEAAASLAAQPATESPSAAMTTTSPSPVAALAVTRGPSRKAIVIAASALLVIAAGAFGFYEWRQKTSSAQQEAPASTQTTGAVTSPAPIVDANPSTAANPVAVPAPSPSAPVATPALAVTQPEDIPKPSATVSVPAGAKQAAPQIAAADRPSPPPSAPPPTAPPAPAPPVPAPVIRQTPADAASGVLRCSGVPVPPGGTVVFTRLPGAMLRFSFDHAAWQPRISHQTDGTQTLTLRSLSRQDQTQCEVHWEIAQ